MGRVIHAMFGSFHDNTARAGPESRAPCVDGTEHADTSSDMGMQELHVQRQALIELCLYALDRAHSGGVVARLEEGLSGVGVIALRPDGERFDPALHEAGGTVATADDALDGVIAETEVVGFADGRTVLRAPVVTVYTTGRAERR